MLHLHLKGSSVGGVPEGGLLESGAKANVDHQVVQTCSGGHTADGGGGGVEREDQLLARVQLVAGASAGVAEQNGEVGLGVRSAVEVHGGRSHSTAGVQEDSVARED